MTEREYRREIRRQVLDVKLMNLRLQGRLRITADDLRAHYRQLVTAERRKLPFRAAWIVIRVARDAAAKEVERQRQRAEWILARARGGASFAELARQYSDDPKTAEAGGLLGRLKFGSLPASVDQALLGLEVGETGGPLRSDQGFVVVRLLERGSSDLPAFEEAAEELQQRVYLEKLDQARGQWLESLRRQTHVEVRL